jgi:hypothetical protein
MRQQLFELDRTLPQTRKGRIWLYSNTMPKKLLAVCGLAAFALFRMP